MKCTENQVERVKRDDSIEEVQPLDKEKLNELLNCGDDEDNDEGYDSESDSSPTISFESHVREIKKLKALDVVFLLDATASMKPRMKGIKRFIRHTLWDATRFVSQLLLDQENILKVGVVIYRDHIDDPVVQVISDLSPELRKLREKVMKIVAKGGGDIPEAVLDGLNAAVSSISWRDPSIKFLYHILDAPPHGKMFTSLADTNELGCPCKYDYEEILLDMRRMEIEYNIIKLSDDIEEMIDKFSKIINIDITSPDVPVESKAKSQYE